MSRPLPASAPDETVAEYVLFGDERRVVRDEAGLKAEKHRRDFRVRLPRRLPSFKMIEVA